MSETEQLELILPDGTALVHAVGTTPLEVAQGIGPGLAKAAVGAEVDGADIDLRTPLTSGGDFKIFTAKNAEAGRFLRHSAEHVMADAVKRLWPEVEIDAGRQDHSEKFQYDFRRADPFTPEDLVAIEAKMHEILAESAVFERQEISRDDALELFASMGENLKVERLADIPDGEIITLYRHGDFTDLCRGPHAQTAKQIGAIKLLEASSVYWRGDEANEKLQRVYGTAFSTKEELETYEQQIEEAAARDHRRLGPQLDLFSFSAHAPASPFFHPRGTTVYNLLNDFIRGFYERDGYGEVVTPQILDVELWHKSGHYDNYRDVMFFTEFEDRELAVKPMNCPAACLVYGTRLRSYRDLPIRYADFGRLHRAERSGVITGLTRVRTFCQDDAHIFCTRDQVTEEVLRVVSTILEIYDIFGFGNVTIELSTRPEKSIGSDEMWAEAEAALHAALQSRDIAYVTSDGEGAFYGPKVDFHVTDAVGRAWQLGTVQLDYILPERFDLGYVGDDGAESRPVLIHRAMLGSIERFIAILLEHTAGALPVWLAPRQAVVLPVSEKFRRYAEGLSERLTGEGFRAEVDIRDEKLGYKIRDAQVNKVPYMIVVGGREEEAGTAALRLRNGEDLGALPIDDIVLRLRDRTESRSLEL